jgi:hypothetical protein
LRATGGSRKLLAAFDGVGFSAHRATLAAIKSHVLIATIVVVGLASGCGAAEQSAAPEPGAKAEQPRGAHRDRAVRKDMPLCPRRAGLTTPEKAEAALSAAYEGVDCGAQTPLVCPRPTDVPSLPKVPTLEGAETTLLAAMRGVECDADAVLASEVFLEALATGHQAHEVRPNDLHISNTSLPVCTDDHLPDPNVATTPEEAEAMPEPPPGTECDGSRGGTLTLCQGGHMNCVMVGEYTGPPKKLHPRD